MNFFDKLKEYAETLQAEMKKFQNKDFMEAITASCALVAAADGTIDSEEKQKMAGFVKRSKELSVFNMTDVIKSFNGFADELGFDHGIGKDACMKAISKITDADASKLLVRVACAIGAADGDFDDDEKNIVREICKEVGQLPSTFSL